MRAKLCIVLLSGPITSPEQRTSCKVALSLSASLSPAALSAEIEFSRLHSSSRLTIFVPSTILIRTPADKRSAWREWLGGEWLQTWRRGSGVETWVGAERQEVTDARPAWGKVWEDEWRKKKNETVFNCVKPHVQRADELRRGRFWVCRRGSWNLAANDCAGLEHKRPAKEGLAFSSEEERTASARNLQPSLGWCAC